MLVLTRKIDQCLHIDCPDGTDICISVEGIRDRNAVRIGIDAPLSYHVDRDDAKKHQPKQETPNGTTPNP